MANSKLMRPTIVGPLMNGRQRQKARTAMDAINSEVHCRTRIERGARMCHVRASHYKCSRSITTRSHNGAKDEGPWEVQGHDKRVCDRSRSPAQPLNDARPDESMNPPDRIRPSSIYGAASVTGPKPVKVVFGHQVIAHLRSESKQFCSGP